MLKVLRVTLANFKIRNFFIIATLNFQVAFVNKIGFKNKLIQIEKRFFLRDFISKNLRGWIPPSLPRVE